VSGNENSREQEISHVIHLNDKDFFASIKSEGLMVTDFWASWCGPCMSMAPVIEELASEYSGRIKFAKVDVDANPVISQQFGILSIPTFLVTNKGKVLDVFIGAMPKTNFEKMIRKFLENQK
jgi:thioredoxin 1